jgi:hypothetical protein
MNVAHITQLFAALEAAQVRYIVCGGVAINLLGLARATQDLDLFVEPTEENIERLKTALRAVFADPCIDEILASDLLGDYPAVQYVPPQGDFHIDVLTRQGEAVRFEDLEAARVPFGGLSVPVATPATLYRMKKDTVRPKDWADAAALRRLFGLKEA